LEVIPGTANKGKRRRTNCRSVGLISIAKSLKYRVTRRCEKKETVRL